MKKRRFGVAPEKIALAPRTREPNFILAVLMSTAKMLFITALVLGFSLTGLLVGVAKAWVETMPALDLTAFDEQAQTTFIYDKNDDLITDFKGMENRVDVSIQEVPQNLINAIVATEDQRFFSHNGVDTRRLVGVVISNFTDGGNQGGSTITQQLIKKTILSDEQTYKRKLQEMYLAIELEKQISKEQIIEEYMNVIYLGGSNYGVKVAAQDYFGKDISELSLRECAMIARIIRNPSKYNPRRSYYVLENPAQCEDGADYVLGLMHDQGLITDSEYNQAMSEKLDVLKYSASGSDLYDNMYYVEYAIEDVVTKMLRLNGLEDTATNRSRMESKLRTGGYSVYTSLDPAVQESVQRIISEWDKYPRMRSSADSIYKASLGNGEYLELTQPQAACTVTNWRTGEVLAIVGGRSTPTGFKQTHRAYKIEMPVGSSIKPLSIYGPAFDMGYSPGTPVLNLPIQISGWDSETGFPENYSGGSYTGVESMRRAIINSHNTAAAQALYSYVGIANSVSYLVALGVDEDVILATGAGLALGSSGISTLQMASAFGAIANGGVYLEPVAFSYVLRSDGEVYMDAYDVQVTRKAFKESTAWLLYDVLKDCTKPGGGGTGTAANFSIDGASFTTAGKTGTNSDYCGVFFAGFTAYYSAAVWIGSDAYKPLVTGATGGDYAAPLWAAIMKQVHIDTNARVDRAITTKSAADVGLLQVEVCGVSGMLPTSACLNDVNGYQTITDYYLSGTEPTKSCNMHRAVKLCTRSKKAASDSCDSTRTYGVIYLPEGHPLRNGVSTVVREYFAGASAEKDTAALARCTICENDAAATYDYALEYIAKARELLDGTSITYGERANLESMITELNKRMVEADINGVRTLGRTLRDYYYSITEE